jgi:hypothetical protein
VKGRELLRFSSVTGGFVAGFALSASTMFVLLGVVGRSAFPDGAPFLVRLPVVASIGVLIIADITIARKRGLHCLTLGLRRQTPKRLQRRLRGSTLGLAWGVDAGSAVSTYRITIGPWALMLLCLLGLGSWWIGPAYALGFLAPLLYALSIKGRPDAADPLVRTMRVLNRGILVVRRTTWVLAAIVVVLTVAS